MNRTQGKVLIVEDDLNILETMADLLEINRYEVYKASDGLRGLEQLERQVPDVIISDIMMPYMDGFDFLRHVRQNRETEHVPVLFVTAKVTLDSKIMGLEFGADDYITKPFEMKELLLKIRNLIDRRAKIIRAILTNPDQVDELDRDREFLRNIKLTWSHHITNPDLALATVAEGWG
ncbi:MAG: response regulator transcription factor [Cytophagales bacterium]|nr:response regulator transcription factor [Cytophagales bacterium]